MSLPRFLFAAVAVASSLVSLRSAETLPGMLPNDAPDPDRDARVAWHKEARFGCFVHWGVYSAIGGEWPGVKSGTYSEHLMRWAKIPRAVYLEQVAKPFNPVKFDADAWVKLMHDAGMRYLIITAKHHDGFAMYPSKVSDYNLTSVTAFKRDPMAELSAACKKYGLRFGFYYSHAFDWEHPDAPGNDWDYDNPGGDKKLHGGATWYEQHPELVTKVRRYIDQKSIPQIKELLLNYKPDIIWFDTPSKLSEADNLSILRAVRETDHHVVVNSRVVSGNKYGDYKDTADRPAEVPYVTGHWEGIPTTNDSYGWSRVDHGHKPPSHFIQLLAKTVSKGGNMLLNIGPMGTGEIDPADVSILHGIGAWMAKNSASIYGCDRTPLAVQAWGTSTSKGRTLFLHVFNWPTDGKLLVAGLKSDPVATKLLGSAKDLGGLRAKRLNADDLELSVPMTAPDAIDSVIELTFNAEPAANSARAISAAAPTTLHVMDGHLTGAGVHYGDGKRNNDSTLDWKDNSSGVDWPVRVTSPGRFRVVANYATASKENTGAFQINFGGRSLSGRVVPTEKAVAYMTSPVGEIELPAGEFTLSVRPTEIVGGELMRLRTIELVPVK